MMTAKDMNEMLTTGHAIVVYGVYKKVWSVYLICGDEVWMLDAECPWAQHKAAQIRKAGKVTKKYWKQAPAPERYYTTEPTRPLDPAKVAKFRAAKAAEAAQG